MSKSCEIFETSLVDRIYAIASSDEYCSESALDAIQHMVPDVYKYIKYIRNGNHCLEIKSKYYRKYPNANRKLQLAIENIIYNAIHDGTYFLESEKQSLAKCIDNAFAKKSDQLIAGYIIYRWVF